MEGVEFKEEWQDEDFPRFLIFFFIVIKIKCITSRISLPLYLPGELTLNNLEVISINIVILKRFCGMFLHGLERDHFMFMAKLSKTGMTLLKFPVLLK